MSKKIAVMVRTADNIVDNIVVVSDDWTNPKPERYWVKIYDNDNYPPVGAVWNGEDFDYEKEELIPIEEMIQRNIDNPNIKDLVVPDDPDYDYIMQLIDQALAERNK